MSYNPVSGAGETLAGFMLARTVGKLKASAEEGWAEAGEHGAYRIENANRALALKIALMDVTACTSEEADEIASLYLRSETVRAAAQALAYKVLGTPKPKKQIPYGYGTSYADLSEQHQRVLERFGAMGITPKRPPLHRDLEAVRAVLDSARLAQEAEAEKERQGAARAEAIRQDILRRKAESEAKWSKRMGFVKGLFGFGSRPSAADVDASTNQDQPAANATGPRPEREV